MSGVRAAACAGALLALTACDGGVGRACPAIGWGSTLVVELAGDRPSGEGRSVRVGCHPAVWPGGP